MILSWGKMRLILRKIGGSKFIELFTPVQDSTELTTTKGDKKEAKIEGGENEAVKYNKNTYSLAAAVRQGYENGKNRKKPLPDSDGIIDGEYELWLQPEDPKAPGMYMPKCVVSVEDTWTAEEGGQWVYTFDAVKEIGHDQVEWGTVTVTGDYPAPTAVTFTEDTEPTAEESGEGV